MLRQTLSRVFSRVEHIFKCSSCGHTERTTRMLTPEERTCPVCGHYMYYRGSK